MEIVEKRTQYLENTLYEKETLNPNINIISFEHKMNIQEDKSESETNLWELFCINNHNFNNKSIQNRCYDPRSNHYIIAYNLVPV